MNYIWDMLIEAKRAGLKKEDITFLCAKVYSPYMELAFEDLNTSFSGEKLEVEVNPYYRYYDIFKYLFPVDYTEHEDLRNVLFDLLMHHLSDTDAYMGMNKTEFYKHFIRKDIENGCFGFLLKESLMEFNETEKQFLLERILRLYKLGDSLALLKETIHVIFHHSSIYINKQEKDEILIYLGERKNKKKEKKLSLILDFFLPVKYAIRIYWDKHFGIIDVKETMKIEEILLY